jgi:hypothetical protein
MFKEFANDHIVESGTPQLLKLANAMPKVWPPRLTVDLTGTETL